MFGRMFKALEVSLIVPDLWQQEAVRALQQGRDVVVQAPTGSGKTYIFELLYPSLKGRAIFTVPTRALANDKLAEWRARNWNVGIATGDLAINTDAKVLVATLETQRARFLRREGPQLFVVDEYQMIGDAVRGVHYELTIALAPKHTQLLLLSGSVANPHDIVAWLKRIGRDPLLVRHDERPVPLQEVDLTSLADSQFVQTRSFWPRMIGRAIRADLAPVLVFAPRRNSAEEMAQQIASAISVRDPLTLSAAQESLVGKRLAKLLRSRVAYHHSGLSYAARAGVIEPLAKAGQLNAVVATMGLAAGINFSMRSVLVTDTRYMAGNFERHVQADELLQMFGRAGRRGLDETGYVLSVPDVPRLGDARSRQLKRAAQVDWPSLISVMRAAAERGEQPFAAAVDLSRSLFSPQNVPLGVEHSLETGARPCGLWVDSERARFVRRPITEMLNSQAEWEPASEPAAYPLGEILVHEKGRWTPALQIPRSLDGLGFGNLCKLPHGYGREIPLAMLVDEQNVAPVKWLRKILQQKAMPRGAFEAAVVPRIAEFTRGGELAELVQRGNTLSARIDFARITSPACRDSLGRALQSPPTREALPLPCRDCDQREHDLNVTITSSPAFAWRTLGLVENDGTPTRRGIVFSFFQAGEGLAVAAALEDESYPIEDLVFDLANLRAGPRFAGEDAVLGGRLGILCQRVYGRADHPGYIEMGVPAHYGSGASEVIRELVATPASRYKFTSDSLRHGDIERALMEWRSLLRHIVGAPDLEWERWMKLKSEAANYIDRSTSPALLDLPPLLASQQRRTLAFAK
ncbi:MAG: DEAD/DEAH box helicase [Chthoniobacterales bacterium]